jgi:hypothetical protein
MAKKVIKITEADIRRIVAQVIKEQIEMNEFVPLIAAAPAVPAAVAGGAAYLAGKTVSDYKNKANDMRAANTKGDYGMIDKAVNAITGGKAGNISRDKERLQNIANMKKQAAANKGMVTVGGQQMRWTDYIAKYQIQPDEIAAAEKINVASTAAQTNQEARYKNLINIQNTVDSNGIIQNPASKLNGTTWSDYLRTYKITPDELAKANEYVKSGAGKTQQQTQQQKQVVARKPDPKVIELQKSLGFTGKDLDGFMGPKTRAAMAAKQKGGTTPAPTFTGQSQIPNLGGKTLQSLFPKASQYTGPSAEQRMNDIMSIQNKKYNTTPPPSTTDASAGLNPPPIYAYGVDDELPPV